MSNITPQVSPFVLSKTNRISKDQNLVFEIASDALWDIYAEACMKSWSVRYPHRKRDPQFLEKGMTAGNLPADLATGLRKYIESLPKHTADISNECPETFAKPYTPQKVTNDLNRERDFYRIAQKDQKAIEPALSHLKEEVEEAYGSCWRIVNVRSWKTFPGAKAGSNDWHGDGLPWPVNKIMVYLTDIEPEVGGTEIELHDGSRQITHGTAGTWCLFQSGYLQHRGIAPTVGHRLVLEIATCPAFETDLTVFHSGYGAKYPISPWDCLDIGTPVPDANQGWTDPLLRQKRVMDSVSKKPFKQWPLEMPEALPRIY